MKLSNSIRKTKRSSLVQGRACLKAALSEAPPEGGAGGSGDPGTGGGTGDPGAGGGADDKKFTQADLNRIGTKEKAEGKAAAEKAIAEQFGCTIEEAKAIIAKAREAEDKTKSEAEKDREAAAKARTEAETAKAEAAAEKHSAVIDRALAKLGFSGDDDAATRVHKMVTAAVGTSYEDVLTEVTELRKTTLSPTLFGEKTGGKGSGGRMPNGDPAGGAPKPTGGEDAYARGAARFKAQQKPGFDPTKKPA